MHAWKRLHYARHGSFRLTKVSKDISECLLTRSRLEVHVQCTASWQNFLLTCYYPTVGLGFMDISTGVKQIAPVQRCPCASGNAIFITPRFVSKGELSDRLTFAGVRRLARRPPPKPEWKNSTVISRYGRGDRASTKFQCRTLM